LTVFNLFFSNPPKAYPKKKRTFSFSEKNEFLVKNFTKEQLTLGRFGAKFICPARNAGFRKRDPGRI
jgi:hypothetical protein